MPTADVGAIVLLVVDMRLDGKMIMRTIGNFLEILTSNIRTGAIFKKDCGIYFWDCLLGSMNGIHHS
jgi:hypothetical protein